MEELRARLKSHGCEVTDVIDHGFVRSIYFNDPNGIALEASWWVVDPTGRIGQATLTASANRVSFADLSTLLGLDLALGDSVGDIDLRLRGGGHDEAASAPKAC